MPGASRSTSAGSLATLKRGPHRTVLLESPAGDGDRAPRVIKRFHSRRLLDRLRDGRRARHELGMLAALRARGLPVPEPFDVRRGAEGWELACSWIPGALPARALLDRGELGGALLRELARTLALAQRAGLDQRDLHAGNALVDEGGGVWLLDFAKARLRRRLPERALVRDLVALCAEAREALPFAARARFLVAWLAASGSSPRGGRAELAARIEREARTRRRAVARSARDRWLRESGVCRKARAAGLELLVPRELDDEDARAAGELLAGLACDRVERRHPIHGALPRGATVLLVRDARMRSLDGPWVAAGHARDHRLPCARPLALAPAVGAAAFELPAGAAPLHALLARADGPLRELLAAGAGRLAGALHDRGLAARPLRMEALWGDERGAVLLGIEARLADARGARADRTRLAPAEEALAQRFAAAFVSELRGGPAERARVREELRSG